MQDKLPVSRIKTPLSLRTMLSFILLITIESWTLNSHNPYRPYSTVDYIIVVMLVMLIVLLVLSIVNALRPAAEIKWGTDSLQIRGETIYAQRIQAIQIDGPVVGIQPVGKRIAPMRLTFRFIDDRAQSMKELTRWAEANGVKLTYKRFVKWM
ncbi:hypothetical protein A3844_05875 [Paenibacillus helianthi]|uniref:Uncharacterized protein n=2 Tax=Paenibacillus helianthi TaxID=1349432 RepID=A0ABX3ESA2_9BACL|nr:hypothetical protein A3844_05875 [Paenibacillus helianthi]